MKRKMLKGYVCVMVSAFIFGCMPLMAKNIYAEGVNPLSLVLYRNLFSVPVLALLAKCKGQSLIISKKAIPSISILAVMGCCLAPVLLFVSYRYLASGTATVFHFVYPAVVVFAEIIFLKGKIKPGNILSIAMCVAGICMFYVPGEPLNLFGSAVALLSGVAFAVYVVLLSSFKYKEISGFVFSFYVALICSVIMLVLCLSSGQFTVPGSFRGWIMIFFFAVAINVGAVVLFQHGTFIIGGERASILSTVEPITSVIIGVLVFHEIIVMRTVFGILLVISASILIAVLDMLDIKNK